MSTRPHRQMFRKNVWPIVCLILILGTGCGPANLPSSSMSPTIKPGQQLTINYLAYTFSGPDRWDIIAFEPPQHTNQVWVMRVVGLPGEKISFQGNILLLNGRPLKLPPRFSNLTCLSPDDSRFFSKTSAISFPFAIPTNSYFVLGDNSANANDSRFWGPLPKSNIIGKVK